MQAKCPACNTLLNIPDHLAGKPVKCQCGKVFKCSAPKKQPAVTQPATRPAAKKSFRIKCPKCNKSLNVEEKLLGQMVKCPCGTKLRTKSQQKTSLPNGARKPNTSVIINYEFAKNFLQRPIVRYECPECAIKLRSNFNEFKQVDACPECGKSMCMPEEVARKIEAFKDGKKLQAAYAREKREEQRNQKQQKKERLRAEALAKQEALRQSKQREREELMRIEAEQVAIRQEHENEFRAARNQLPDSAHQWLAKANTEDYWVRKDFYHLRAYTEAYLAGEEFFCKPAQQLVLEADQHDNFLGAKLNIWNAIFYSLEAKYGPSQKAKRIFDQVNSTNVWDGMSYYSLLAILELLCEHFPSTEALARSEHEKHHRHDAWLCAHYYTLRAIITLLHGKIDDHPRYSAYFENIENNYDVWQALVSCTIELFVEVNVFAEID